MINGLMPKLHVITLEGFNMVMVKKRVGFNNPLALTFKETYLAAEGCHHGVAFQVYDGQVIVYGSAGVTLSTDEAIKLFAGLLEDIKAASAG